MQMNLLLFILRDPLLRRLNRVAYVLRNTQGVAYLVWVTVVDVTVDVTEVAVLVVLVLVTVVDEQTPHSRGHLVSKSNRVNTGAPDGSFNPHSGLNASWQIPGSSAPKHPIVSVVVDVLVVVTSQLLHVIGHASLTKGR